MKDFKEYLNEGRVDEAQGRSPFANRDIDVFLKNAGLTDIEWDTIEYGGYNISQKTHVFAVVWANEEDDFEENDDGDPLNYAVNIMWVYLGQSGKIEADVSPMPAKENLHLGTAKKLAGPIARKESKRTSR